MRKILLVPILSLVFLFGCSVEAEYDQVPKIQQQAILYQVEDVKVIRVERHHKFTGIHHYGVEITVHSDSRNLTEAFWEESSGMFTPEHYNLNEDDIIQARINITHNQIVELR